MSFDDRTDVLDANLRRLVAEQVGIAPPATSWNKVVAAAGADRPSDPRPSGIRWTTVVAAAACVGVLIIGLVALNRRGERDSIASDDAAVATTVPVAPIPLNEVVSLGPNDWVAPTTLPPGVEFLWAFGFDNKVLTLGTILERPEYTISIMLPSDPDARTPFPLVVSGDWVETAVPGQWRVRRAIGQAVVAVQGPGPYDEAAMSFLDSLMVVPMEGLPILPIDPNGPMTPVASYEFDGVEYRFEVVESNGVVCSRVAAGEGGSGGCGPLSSDGGPFLSGHPLADFDGVAGSEVGRVTAAGVVRGDVAAVEIVFVDGSVVRVDTEASPVVMPGQRFWVVAADVTIEGVRSYSAVMPIAATRAFNGDNELLDVVELGPIGSEIPLEEE